MDHYRFNGTCDVDNPSFYPVPQDTVTRETYLRCLEAQNPTEIARNPNRGMDGPRVFMPVLVKYVQTGNPAWADACIAMLKEFHAAMQREVAANEWVSEFEFASAYLPLYRKHLLSGGRLKPDDAWFRNMWLYYCRNLHVWNSEPTIGNGKPLVLIGYSNGGALAVNYAIDALETPGLPRPDGLLLVSPMIGVTPFAALSRVLPLLSGIPYFDRSAWTSVAVEYNPFKYNSFPANGGLQSHLVTRALNQGLTRLATAGRLREVPPVLTFQSSVDATVLTDAVVTRLYDQLDANGSELVMFDLDRREVRQAIVRPEALSLFKNLFHGQLRP